MSNMFRGYLKYSQNAGTFATLRGCQGCPLASEVTWGQKAEATLFSGFEQGTVWAEGPSQGVNNQKAKLTGSGQGPFKEGSPKTPEPSRASQAAGTGRGPVKLQQPFQTPPKSRPLTAPGQQERVLPGSPKGPKEDGAIFKGEGCVGLGDSRRLSSGVCLAGSAA